MLRTLRIESVRGRLTLFYVSVLAAALVIVGILIYVLLARALYVRVDENLQAAVGIAMTSLSNDLAEGQDYEDAARSTAAEQSSSQQMLAIYDREGRLLAESGRDGDLEIALPPIDTIPDGEERLETVLESDGETVIGSRFAVCRFLHRSTSSWSAQTSNRWTRSWSSYAAFSGTSSRLR